MGETVNTKKFRSRGWLATEPRTRATRRLTAVIAVGCLTISGGLLAATNAYAVPQASLDGSTFQIDENANLVADSPTATDPQTVDWASLAHATAVDPERRAIDVATGQNDDSYQGGVKEDTSCPGETTGSIPNNKSDLLSFHVYTEPATTGNKGFLNLAWSRVSEPSGTTLMDFEFNQSSDTCTGSPNKVRTGDGDGGPAVDDVLIEYAITQGGATASITKRDWTGSAWDEATPLTDNSPICDGKPCAVGTINTTPIAAADSDGLIESGSKQARTFGEAQIDLRMLFQTNNCAAFGSAMLKSRSSDSFTSQLKDFIRPIEVNISNCASITITKVKQNAPAIDATSFGYTATGTGLPTAFSLPYEGALTRTFSNLNPGNFSVTETVPTAPWGFVSLSCTSTGAGTSTTTNARTANITLGNGGTASCTYTNHYTNSPTIATLLDPAPVAGVSTINVGGTAKDSATLTGASANAEGTVTYTVYTDSACSANPVAAGTTAVTNGVVPDSDAVTFNTFGHYYWQAVYSGDANNQGASSVCMSEHLLVKASPSIATILSQEEIVVGGSVHDTSTLTGSTTTAGGTVTYTVYTDNACSANPRDAGTKTVVNGVVPNSDSLEFNTPGDYYWQAVYSGDAENNGATSVCTSEHLLVKAAPSIATVLQNDVINLGGTVYDTAQLTNATANAGGTVTYRAYTGVDTCSGTPLFEDTVTVTNGVVPNSSAFTPPAPGYYSFQAEYSGDANNEPATSLCGTEDLKVMANPAIATVPSTGIVVGAGTIHDVANITAGNFADPTVAVGNVTFKLYGPFAADATLGADSCVAGKLLQTVTVAATRTGDTTAIATSSPNFTPTTVGKYQWVANYSGNELNNAAEGLCGDASEQVVVSPATPSLTTKILLSDSAKVTGTLGAGDITGKVTFQLYGSADCSGSALYTSAPTTIAADGTATSGTYAASAGTYSWKVTFSSESANYLGKATTCSAAQSDEKAVISYAGGSPTL